MPHSHFMHKLPHPHPTLSAKESELSDIPIVIPPVRSWFWFSKHIIGKSTCCCQAFNWTELNLVQAIPCQCTTPRKTAPKQEAVEGQWKAWSFNESPSWWLKGMVKKFFPRFTHFPGCLTGTVGTQNASRVITYSLCTFAMPSPKGLLWVCHLYHWHIIISPFTACV